MVAYFIPDNYQAMVSYADE